ncbi:DUF6582 domain-containing protein [Actinoplanes sp. NPDC026623]|jgi:hypothetical protein|uniref:DUF6582 domain-containing protein n=1 Tax=Actinoplanes sp. NPDC026623 TaxID=3155610 RepID=UPI0033EA52FE
MATRKQSSNELDAGERNALRDDTFAFPRVRKEPLNDAKHVRNAIARFDQVQDVTDRERDEAFRRIKRAAEKFGVEMTETTWRELGKPAGKPAESRDQLYAEARRRDVKGRSKMTKAELARALKNR